MPDSAFQPSTVTKPIQLLAAWLIGLIAVNASFLGAAGLISRPTWAAGTLVLAAVLDVPIFLACLFLLQTKFRPEMQEDTFYSKYLERRSSQTGKLEKFSIKRSALRPVRDSLRYGDELISPSMISATKIELNDLTPGYERISMQLKSLGLTINSTFGSTSQRPHTPKNLVVAFGPGVTIPVLQAVVRISFENGFRGIARLDSEDGLNDERIYVGAYSFDDGGLSFSQLDKDFLSVLGDPSLTEERLSDLVSLASDLKS